MQNGARGRVHETQLKPPPLNNRHPEDSAPRNGSEVYVSTVGTAA